MNNAVCVNDIEGTGDSQRIKNAVAEAKKCGCNRVVIPKINEAAGRDFWSIDETIALPGDIEIILDGARLVMAENTFCNMFATENYINNEKAKLRNISIIGLKGAVLDGGVYNGLCEKNSLKNGNPHIRCNSMIMIYYASDVRIENVKIMNQRWWAITNMFVSDSVFKNIEFKADLSRIDESGVHHPDELPKTYEETYIKNADGIDLRIGCNNIAIENISGFTEDDTVALTALLGFEKEYIPDGAITDIHHVKIRNVSSDCYYTSNVRLLCGMGCRIHHVDIENINDTRTNTEYASSATVRLGDKGYGAKNTVNTGDMSDISVRSVNSRGRCAVALCNSVVNTEFSDIRSEGLLVKIAEKTELINVQMR